MKITNLNRNSIIELNEISEFVANELISVISYSSGNLNISNIDLVSLIGCPKEITGNFDCYNNKLLSLEGCPEKITGYFSCSNNQLSSFEHFPKYMGDCYIADNNFTSFKDIDQHIKQINDGLYAANMSITSGYSDLFGIDGLEIIYIDDTAIQNIVNKYLPKKI